MNTRCPPGCLLHPRSRRRVGQDCKHLPSKTTAASTRLTHTNKNRPTVLVTRNCLLNIINLRWPRSSLLGKQRSVIRNFDRRFMGRILY
jgi:hypothetical protein